MADAWPFDADQHDPLAKLRIPVVSNPYPGWKYEVCLFVNDPADRSFDPPLYGHALRPDDREAGQIVAYIEWRMEYYNEGWKRKMRQRPLDVDSSTNTVILRKRADGGWQYRRWSWDHGPMFVPGADEVLTLERLLDKVNDLRAEKWAEWKTRHPEAFGAVAASGR